MKYFLSIFSILMMLGMAQFAAPGVFAANGDVTSACKTAGLVPVIDENGVITCQEGKPTLQNIGGFLGDVVRIGYGEETLDPSQLSLPVLVGKLVQGALMLVGMIFFIMMVYGGYQWLISRGDSEIVKKGEDTVRTAVIGFIIVAAAYVITSFVSSRLTAAVLPS